jgi:hypothetical protein
MSLFSENLNDIRRIRYNSAPAHNRVHGTVCFCDFSIYPGFIPKLMIVIIVNLFNGWYSILQGRLYSSLPGQSVSLMAIGSVTARLAKLFPFLIGFLADQFGLQTAMWTLILGPIALLIGLPRRKNHISISNLQSPLTNYHLLITTY